MSSILVCMDLMLRMLLTDLPASDAWVIALSYSWKVWYAAIFSTPT
jgi:hypothetical protein